MGTFNFDFKCNVCRIGRKNRFMAFTKKFDMYIENKIESFICCNQCSEMYKYEEIYNGVEFNKLNKIEKQIHCLFTYFDNDYKKLKKFTEKKNYLKNIMEDDECDINKSVINKFLNDTVNVRMIETFKSLFLKNRLREFDIIYETRIEWRISFRGLYEEDLIYVFKTVVIYYLKDLLKLADRYFNYRYIQDYIIGEQYIYG